MPRILSTPLLQALHNAGLINQNTRRVVIDIQAGEAPIMYVEQFGDDRLLSVVQALDGIKIDRQGRTDNEEVNVNG